MKKFIAALLCVFTLIAFSACDKNVSTDKKFKDAYDKTAALDSYECKMTVNESSSTEGLVTKTTIELAMKTENAKSEKPVSEIKTSIQLPGIGTSVTNVYMDDKYVYVDDGESKTKIALDDEDLKDMMALLVGNSDISDVIVELPADLLKDVELKKGDNGSSSFELELTAEQFKTAFKEIVDSYGAVGDSYEGVDVTVDVKDAKVKVTIDKKGYISVYEISFKIDMSTSYEGGSVNTSTEVSTKIEFVNPGDKVTVTAPADLDEYVDFEIPDFEIPDFEE